MEYDYLQRIIEEVKPYERRIRAARIVILIISMAWCIPVMGQEARHSKELEPYLSNLPFTMPKMTVPEFPDRKFSIVEYGAVNDGRTLNTAAITKAIKACAESGGGTVIVPPGTWLTGAIKLESNVNLHLQSGALLQFSKRFEDYPLIAGFDGRSKKFILTPPIHSFRAKNIAITGQGIIDGAGEAWRYVKKEKLTARQWNELTASGGVVTPDGKQWWPSQESMEGEEYLKKLEQSGKTATAEEYAKAREFLRPDMVRLVQSENILLDGPTFQNSPRFHVYPVQSENIIVRNIHIRTLWYAQNGDGLDFNSCRNVLVYNTRVDVGDDAICLKPGNISERQKPGPACENIVITDCIVYHGHGGFVIGSESSGGARNVYVNNCTFIGTDVGLRFKSLRGKGGIIENITIENIQMRSIVDEAILFDMYYGEGSPEELAHAQSDTKKSEPLNERTPQFRNFTIKNIVCNGANRAVLFNGLPEMPVKNITMENISLVAEKGVLCIDTDGIVFKNASIFPQSSPVVTIKQSSNIVLDGMKFPKNPDVFLSVFGEKSSNIRLENIDFSGVKETVTFGNNAQKSAVIIK